MDKRRKQELEERHIKLFKALAKDVARRLTLITAKPRPKAYGYGQPLQEPLCGHHFKLPSRSELKKKPVLDLSLSYVSISIAYNFPRALLLGANMPTQKTEILALIVATTSRFPSTNTSRSTIQY